MSELKFKIWDPEDKYMDSPNTMEDIANGNIYEKYYNHYSDFHTYTTRTGLREDLIFLRYTGFKDMLDEEIYEGDLLEDGCKIINKVQFNDTEGQWWVTPNDLDGWMNGYDAVPLSQFLSDNPDAEVIGNKHTTQMFTYCHDSKLWKKSV